MRCPTNWKECPIWSHVKRKRDTLSESNITNSKRRNHQRSRKGTDVRARWSLDANKNIIAKVSENLLRGQDFITKSGKIPRVPNHPLNARGQNVREKLNIVPRSHLCATEMWDLEKFDVTPVFIGNLLIDYLILISSMIGSFCILRFRAPESANLKYSGSSFMENKDYNFRTSCRSNLVGNHRKNLYSLEKKNIIRKLHCVTVV